MNQLLAADVMHAEIVTVLSDTSVIEAARTMLAHRISGLPVTDRAGRVVGMVTEGDLLRRTETGTERHRSHWLDLLLGSGRAAADYATTHARKVSEVMSDQIFSVSGTTPLEEIVTLMERHQIKRVPVLDQERLVGIVSRADLLRALVEAAPKPDAAPVPDENIRDLIRAEIDRQVWSPRATVDVTVKDGSVELRGSLTDERERAALRILVENAPGVKEVVDHLVWIEPMSGMVIEPPAGNTNN